MDDPEKESEESEKPENQIAEERNKKFIDAATEGDNDSINRLLDEGAEISSKKYGDTGLHISAMWGHQSVMLTLLTRGLDVNIRGEFERTALMEAANWGKTTCVQTLMDHGALTDLQDYRGYTALMFAVQSTLSNPDIVGELLVRQADVHIVNPNIRDDEQRTALMMAAREGRLPCVQTLLEHGALTDCRIKMDTRP